MFSLRGARVFSSLGGGGDCGCLLVGGLNFLGVPHLVGVPSRKG